MDGEVGEEERIFLDFEKVEMSRAREILSGLLLIWCGGMEI